MTKNIENIVSLMHERYDQDISMYDQSFLKQTIAGRLSTLLLQTVEAYILYLNQYSAEAEELVGSLSNSHSEFFRNPISYNILERYLIPGFFLNPNSHSSQEIRCWSAGCAAGQEAYSMAIMLDEFKNLHNTGAAFRIFATDNSPAQLEMAGKGVYSFNALQNIKLRQLIAYFTEDGDSYHLCQKIKSLVDFSIYDLLEKDTNAPSVSIYGDFDIILCCNVLFYYKPEIQRYIIEKFCKSLKPGGILITGEAESGILKQVKKLKQFCSHSQIFVKL